jgi:Ca2+-binding EF-hand superfamily protein
MKEAQALSPKGSGESMASRVKEVFQRFDTGGDGVLDIDEMQRMLKTLAEGFTNDQIEGFCHELDSSKDGKISCKEFIHWLNNSPAAGSVAKAIVGQTGDARAARIKAVFVQYDRSGDGNLDISEMGQVLKSLGSFTTQEIKVVCTDLDKNKDGQISFQEFNQWIRSGSGAKSVTKAKAMLAPSDTDGLEAIFYKFCGLGRSDMDAKHFVKMCKDCRLVDKKLTEIALDLLFKDTRIKPKGQGVIDFFQFEVALDILAEKKGWKREQLRDTILESTGPILQGTKADVVRFHDDRSTYTGVHRTTSAPLLVQTETGAVGSFTGPASPSPKSPTTRRRPKTLDSPGGGTGTGMRPESPVQDVDNSDLWRTFGIHTPAGRTLKRVYAKRLDSSLSHSSSLPAIQPKAWQSPFLLYRELGGYRYPRCIEA